MKTVLRAGMTTIVAAVLAVTWSCARDSDADADADAPGTTTARALASAPIPPLPAGPPREDFAGSASCAACHTSEFAAWRTSTHGSAGGRPGLPSDDVRVIAPFDGTPLRFRDAVVTPQRDGAVYSFLVSRPGERDTTLRVSAVIGGGHMQGGGTQGFLTTYPDGTLRFLPFDWSRQNRAWFCNSATRAGKGWLPISSSLRLADCGDWPPTRVLGDEPRFSNCQGCHGSQIALGFDSAANRWKTTDNGLSINCESCHGPAARHVELMRRGSPPSGDIGLVALATQTKEQSLATCFACHALKDRIATRPTSGTTVAEHYALQLPQLSGRPYTPDGRTRTFAYQEGHLASDCYRNGGMTCTSCHDPHSQGYRAVDGTPLPTRTDDRQCTACHASKAVEPARHTKHPPQSTGSRCVSCHMPYEQQHELGRAIRYARADHSIAIPRPQLDSSLGITSACRGCHASVSDARHAKQVEHWWGTVKPHEVAVDGVLAARSVVEIGAATPLLLRPESRNAMAQIAGLAEWIDRYASPDMDSLPPVAEQRIRALVRSPDLDVRGVSLALLHLTRGHRAETRRFLAGERGAEGLRSGAVARRWSVVLGGMGDMYRERRDPSRAVMAYRKSLEVDPGNPATQLNLALALAETGDLTAAVSMYQISLGGGPRQPLAEVNLGIALERLGDAEAGRAAYRRAIALDSFSALGYMNMGTSLLRDGRELDALPYLQQAVGRDPGLAVGHFQLALARLRAGRIAEAEASVRRALALDTSLTEARKLSAALREARSTAR